MMTPIRKPISGWVWVVALLVLFFIVIFLTNDHLRCTLTGGEWVRGYWDVPSGCRY